MYIESYKYYKKMYGESPSFHRGLKWIKLPVMLCFLLLGVILSPLHLVKGSWLFGLKIKKGNNRIVEFIFGSTHNKISKILQLEDVDRFYFNLSYDSENYFTDKRLLLIAVVYGIEVFNLLIKAESDSITRLNGVRLIKMVAISKIAKYYMNNYEVFIQYNDHIPYNVMLQQIAKREGLKTVYVQHAPISFKFPPLYHDFNALFSEDSLEKYKITSDFNIKVDYDVFFDIRFRSKKIFKEITNNTILICFNKVDNIERLKELIIALKKEKYHVIVRPHPEDYRNFSFESSVVLSRGMSLWEDLERSSFVVVNESAVPLESIFCNKPTYKLSYLDYKFNDNYNFLKKGLLTKEYNKIDDLIYDLSISYVPNNEEKLPHFVGDVKRADEMLINLKKRIELL